MSEGTTETPSMGAPNLPTAPAKWDRQPMRQGTWVKVRDLVNSTFDLEAVKPAKIKGKDSYVFEIGGNRQFSSKMGDAIFGQIVRSGIPPLHANYTIEQTTTKAGTTCFLLRAL